MAGLINLLNLPGDQGEKRFPHLLFSNCFIFVDAGLIITVPNEFISKNLATRTQTFSADFEEPFLMEK